MEVLKKIARSLLNDIDMLELQYHVVAIENFYIIYEFESEFGGIPYQDFEEFIDENGCEEQREIIVTHEKCDKENMEYFDTVGDIIHRYKQEELTLTNALSEIKLVEIPFNALTFYDYKLKKLRKSILDKVIELNHMLTNPIQRVVRMEEIQVKKNITVKEFADIYNISKTSQQNYRGRFNDPLPYHQKVEGGKITYVVKEVEEWLENQHK